MTQDFQPVSGLTTPRFAGPLTFMRLPRVDDPAAVDIALVGVPWDGGTTNRPGARHGPREIRAMSSLVRLVHPVTRVAPFALCRVADLGDAPVDPFGQAESLAAIEDFVRGIVAAGAVPLTAGGDHLISLPILRAVAAQRPVGLVQFDSHSDTWDTSFGRYRYTHATPFRRAIEEGLVDPLRTVQIGIRGSLYAPEDLAWAEAQGVRIVTIEEVYDRGLPGVIELARAVAGAGPVYLSFDIDSLDPAFAPGTGTPEVGGLTTHEAQRLVRGLRGLDLVGGDVVEVSPPFDQGGMTALVGATMMFEILCLLAEAAVARRSRAGAAP